jgi:oligopeptidase A
MAIDFQIKDLETRVKSILDDSKKLIQQAENGKTWEEIFTPLDTMDEILGRETALQSHLNSVCFSDEFNAEYEKTLPLLSNFYSELGSNENLYSAFNNIDKNSLSEQQNYILKNVLRDFKLSGIGLSAEKKAKYSELSSKLSLLSNEFAKNSLQATNAYTKKIDKKDLKGLDENELVKLETENGYALNLQMPGYMAVMTYCESREIRKELYTAYISKASEFDDYDNTKTMNEILEVRAEFAKLLDFENYAEYSLATKMTNNTNEVEEFLNDLIEKSKNQAKNELKSLQEFANNYENNCLKDDLKPWDLGFYSEKQKQKEYGFSKSEIAEYFPFEKVLSGLLDLIDELYNIKVKITNEKTYHEDALVLDFASGGKIYLDPFARKDKKSGAWMNDYQGLNDTQQPIAFVVCNGSKPTDKTPSLLEFDEVITLFHEFGHALHHILTTVKYPSVAGINGVPWDGVELPSQYMEFFAYEKSTIKKISGHYKDGKTLPNDLFDKLIASKNYGSGMAMLRQCEFGLWDILTHKTNKNTYEVLGEVREKTSLLNTISENRFLNSFGHIFSGGYAAGYYSYKWAEVLAADAYGIIQKDKNKTADFRKHILATGGSADFMESYIKFSGKKPDVSELLKSCGIV